MSFVSSMVKSRHRYRLWVAALYGKMSTLPRLFRLVVICQSFSSPWSRPCVAVVVSGLR